MVSARMRGAFIKNVEQDVLDNRTTAWANTEELNKATKQRYEEAGKEIIQKITELMIEVQGKGGEWTPQEVWKFNRLNNLIAQINKIAHDLGLEEIGQLRDAMESNYITSYLQVSYALGQGMSIGVDFQKLDPRYIQQAIDYPWSGAMFSDRIWDNQKLLVKSIRENVTQSMVLGEGMAKLAKRINDNMGNSAFNCMRVARTEMMRVSYIAEQHSMKDSGVVEQVQYYATIPSERTCPVCGSLHKKIFKMGDEPQLPKHPQCRCTYLPVIPEYGIIQGDGHGISNAPEINTGADFDSFMKQILKERDKQVNNPNYANFKDKFMKDMQGINLPKTKADYILGFFDKMRVDIKDMVTKYYDNVGVKHEEGNSYHYLGNLYLQRFKEKERQAEVFWHELGHGIDFYAKKEKNGGINPTEYIGMDYMKAPASKDIKALLDNYRNNSDFRSKVNGELRRREVDPAVSDIFCSLTHAEVQGYWGHSREYYQRAENRMYSETFANLTSLYARGQYQDVEYVRQYFPNVVKAYDELVRKINKGEM